MGNCQALLTFPEEVMKILHVVFASISVLFIILYGYVDVYGSLEFLDRSGKKVVGVPSFSSRTGVNEFPHVTAQGLWLIMMCLALVCGVALLVWFIFDDPRTYKTLLMLYYFSAFAFCFAGFLMSVFWLDSLCKTKAFIDATCEENNKQHKETNKQNENILNPRYQSPDFGFGFGLGRGGCEDNSPGCLAGEKNYTGYIVGGMIFTVFTAVTYFLSALLNATGKP